MKHIQWLAVPVLLALLCSCTSVQDMLEQETADLTPPASDSIDLTDIPDYLSMPLDDYVAVGQYTGLEITIDQVKVTDAQVNEAIDGIKTVNGLFEKVTTRAVAWGDTVVLSYYCMSPDGERRIGEDNVEVKLAEGGAYPDDFVKGLIGAPCGIAVAITLGQEESGESEGELLTYTATVSYIKGEYKPLTDDFVSSYTGGACTKADEFFAYYKEQLWNELYYETAYDAIWKACKQNCKADVVPDEAVLYYMESMEDYYRRMAASNGVSYSEVLAAFDLDEIKIMQLAYGYAEDDMIFYALIHDAKLSVSDEQYQKALHDYAVKYFDTFAPAVGTGSGQGGSATLEDVKAYLDREQGNIIREQCYDTMLYDYLYENNRILMGEIEMN